MPYLYLLIICIPLFFIVNKILSKKVKYHNTRLILTLLAYLFFAFIMYQGLIALLHRKVSHIPKRTFKREEWLTEKTLRFQMIDDIINSKMLLGSDSNNVKKLLGEPSNRSNSNHLWIYDAGQGGGGMGFLFHYLNITYEEGKVIKVVKAQVKD